MLKQQIGGFKVLQAKKGEGGKRRIIELVGFPTDKEKGGGPKSGNGLEGHQKLLVVKYIGGRKIKKKDLRSF